MAIKHVNNGACEKCLQIIDKYPGFYEPLRDWFIGFQSRHPEAHVSCAGRGHDDQEMLLARRATRAKYGQSAHNYNCALDLFELSGDIQSIYEDSWFRAILKPELPSWLNWYGFPGSKFYELPHVEPINWKKLRDTGLIVLVEPHPQDEE